MSCGDRLNNFYTPKSNDLPYCQCKCLNGTAFINAHTQFFLLTTTTMENCDFVTEKKKKKCLFIKSHS